MRDKEKIDEEKIDEEKRLLKEIKASKEETAVTVEEVVQRPSVWKRVGGTVLSLWTRPFVIVSAIIIVVIALFVVAFYTIFNSSTFKEEKAAVIERIQNLNELATVEVHTKAIVERQDNKVFGKSIGVNLPGTKRQLLVIIPGSIKAGVQLGNLTEKDIQIDEENKTATLTLPRAEFLGGAELKFDEADIFSYEGLFRGKANIAEAYDLAEEAKSLILLEADEQGALEMAESNAQQALSELFTFIGYDVSIQYTSKE